MPISQAHLIAHLLLGITSDLSLDAKSDMSDAERLAFITTRPLVREICTRAAHRPHTHGQEESSILELGRFENTDPDTIQHRISAKFPLYQGFVFGVVWGIMCMPIRQVSPGCAYSVLTNNMPVQVIRTESRKIVVPSNATKKLTAYLATAQIPGLWCIRDLNANGNPVIETMHTRFTEGIAPVRLVLTPERLQTAGVWLERKQGHNPCLRVTETADT